MNASGDATWRRGESSEPITVSILYVTRQYKDTTVIEMKNIPRASSARHPST